MLTVGVLSSHTQGIELQLGQVTSRTNFGLLATAQPTRGRYVIHNLCSAKRSTRRSTKRRTLDGRWLLSGYTALIVNPTPRYSGNSRTSLPSARSSQTRKLGAKMIDLPLTARYRNV